LELFGFTLLTHTGDTIYELARLDHRTTVSPTIRRSSIEPDAGQGSLDSSIVNDETRQFNIAKEELLVD